MTRRVLIAVLLGALGATAQTPAPVILAVTSGAFGNAAATEDGLATVFGTGLSDSVYAAGSLPLPTHLGPTTLNVCLVLPAGTGPCYDAQLLYVSALQVNFYLPAGMVPPSVVSGGSCTYCYGALFDFTLTVAGQSTTFRSGVSTGSPAVFQEGFDCNYNPDFGDTSPCQLMGSQTNPLQPLRGSVVDLQGRLITSTNPVRVGQYYSIYLTGLGANTDVRIEFTLSTEPPDDYASSYVTGAQVAYAGESSFAGLQQINFTIPSTQFQTDLIPLTCGAHQYELGTTILLTYANSTTGTGTPAGLSLPLQINAGDMPCQ